MAILRNDWGMPRICPTLDYHEVPAGETITVPDDEVVHWVAAGPWTPVDAAAKAAAKAPPVDSTPAAAPATPTKDGAPSTPEGKKS